MINFWIGRWCFVLVRFDGMFDWAWKRWGYDCEWVEYSRVIDWMIETARAALRGEPVPELTDGPHADESGHQSPAGVHVSAETIAYLTAKANEGLQMSTNDYTSEGMREHLSGFSKGILTTLDMIEIAAANSQPRNVGWYYWTGSEWTWTAPD